MPRRRSSLLLLFTDVFCVSDSVPTQACIAIGVLTLFSQLAIAQQRIFGEIPRDIEHTQYTLLTAPNLKQTADVFYAVVVGDSPMAIILNKNYDIIKQVPANIFTSNTLNIKTDIKPPINAKNIEINKSQTRHIGTQHNPNAEVIPDTPALSQVKTETFPSTSYTGRVNLQTGEVNAIQENNVQENTEKVLSKDFTPYNGVQTRGSQGNYEQVNLDHSMNVKTESIADLLLRAAQERLQELGFGTSNQVGRREATNEYIYRPQKQSSELINVKTSTPTLNSADSIGSKTKKAYSNNFINTNEKYHTPPAQLSNPLDIQTLAPKLNLAEYMETKTKQTLTSSFLRNTNEVVQTLRTKSSKPKNIESSKTKLNQAANMESQKKQSYSNNYINTIENIYSSETKSSSPPYSETAATNLNPAENIGNEKKQRYSNSLIEKLLWTPEDIGKRRVIHQQNTQHQIKTQQTVTNSLMNSGENTQIKQYSDTVQSVTRPLTVSGDSMQIKQPSEVNALKEKQYSAENSKFETYSSNYFNAMTNMQDNASKPDNGVSKKAAYMEQIDHNLTALPMDEIYRFPTNLRSKVSSPDFGVSNKLTSQQTDTRKIYGATNKLIGVAKISSLNKKQNYPQQTQF